MDGRLMLGCGQVGREVVQELAVPWLVIETEPERVEILRESHIDAELGDPSDPDLLRSHGPADVVFVASDDPGANLAAAKTAAEVFPEAMLTVYTGMNGDEATRSAFADLDATIVDPGAAIATTLRENLAGEEGKRLAGLMRTLRGIEGHLGVFTHDNPDPDAIGSAIALRDLARYMGIDADAYFFGQITHQENRALVNLLDLQLENLGDDEFEPVAFDAIALVDHSRPGVNDQLPVDTPIDIVIDHHPPRDTVAATFVDRRSDVGATSTLLADYFRRLGIPVSPRVATALLFGIRVDTKDFGREITESDFEAAAFLFPFADEVVLERIESPSVSGPTLDIIADAIRNRIQHDSIVLSAIGTIANRDSLAQAADHLLGMEGVDTTVVYGIMDGTVYVSARTRGTDLDIGETMRQAFDRIGSAGGHTDMAGAQIPLGILGDLNDEEDDVQLETVVEEVITNRFFEVVGLRRALDTTVVLSNDRGPPE